MGVKITACSSPNWFRRVTVFATLVAEHAATAGGHLRLIL
jgi:hypothetical protein